MHFRLLGAIIVATIAIGGTAEAAQTEYLSDIILSISSYGLDYSRVVGLDTAAYPLWPKPIPGEPIKIGDKAYAKGIGASYTPITVMLDDEYELLESEVGVQNGTEGTDTFQVTLDGKVVFDSGPMTASDSPKQVRVPLTGAQTMLLSAAGSGKAVWADARLTRRAGLPEAEPVDVGPFARVVTWDPAKMVGVTVSRLEEFPAEEAFPETDLRPAGGGSYAAPVAKNGEACIGLQWIERRRLREIGLQFAGAAPETDGVRAEGWALRDPLVLEGHSEWQGRWVRIEGTIEKSGDTWVMRIPSKENREVSEGTYKIRWIFPAGRKVPRIKRLMAISTGKWMEADLVLEADKTAGGRAEIEVYNGEIIRPDGSDQLHQTWNTETPLRLKVRYTKPRPWGSDRTVLRVRMPGNAFGIAVDDVLDKGCVYVRDAGLYVAKEPASMDMAGYKKSIGGRETHLEQVRRMPDQEFSKAIAKSYIPAQDRSPTMLSLACDNRKVILQRNGEIGFGPLYLDLVQYRNECRLIPTFGSGAGQQFSDIGTGSPAGYERKLDNGWMPIPRITVRENGLVYEQAVFVAPFDKQAPPEGSPWWQNNRPVCVAEYHISNPQAAPDDASLKLAFTSDAREAKAAEVEQSSGRFLVKSGGKLLAVVDVADAAGMQAKIEGGALVLSGPVKPGARAAAYAYMPLEWEVKPGEEASLTGAIDLRAAAENYWTRIMSPSAQITTPDTVFDNLVRASEVHCMLAARSEDDGKRIDPWIASSYYCSLDTESHAIIYGMDLMGQHEFARRGFDFFIKRLNPAGFLAHGYTLMGTGQHLWFLSDHYRLTGDAQWWRGLSPTVTKVCEWIVRQTEKTRRLGADGKPVPEYGLVPPATVADWQDWGYIFSMEGYHYAGLHKAADALAEVGDPKAAAFDKAAGELKRNILRAYKLTQAEAPVVPLANGTWVPYYPMRLFKPGHAEQFFPNYATAWLYDVELGANHLVDEGVLDPNCREVDWMMDHMEDEQFLRATQTGAYPAPDTTDDWFDNGGYPRSQPYYGRYPELCAKRDDVKAFVRTYFNQLAVIFNREDLSCYENPGASVWNKTHETGHFLQQTRLMMVMERDKGLWLAPFVTNNWMKDGMTVAVGNVPTFYGPVSYTIRSHAADGFIQASIDPPTRETPGELVIRLRHPEGRPMLKAEVHGAELIAFDPSKEIVRIKPGKETITVRAQY